MKKLKSLFELEFLKQWTPLRIFLFFAIIVFSAAYCFIMWTFSSRVPWNYITILISVIMILLIVFYNSFYTQFRFGFFTIFIGLFILTSLFSFLFNATDSSFPKSLILVYLLSFFVYQFVSNDKIHLKWFIYSIFIGTLLFSVYYLVYYFPDLINFQSFTRLGDKFDNQNAVAISFAILGLLSFYLMISKKMWYLSPLLLLMIYLCLSTGSISNILCFIAVIFITSLVYSNKKGKIITIVAAIVTIIIIIVLLQFPFAEYFKNRIDNMINTFFGTNGNIDYSSAFRFDYAITGFNLFFDKPLFGNGYGSVSLFTYGKGTFSHNNIAELLSNFGIVGFAIFEVLLIAPFFQINNNRKRMGLFSIALFIFIFQLFLVIFYLKIIGYFIPLFWGLFDRKSFFIISFSFDKKKIRIKFEKMRQSIVKSKDNYCSINV